jgi:hypothetical protein
MDDYYSTVEFLHDALRCTEIGSHVLGGVLIATHAAVEGVNDCDLHALRKLFYKAAYQLLLVTDQIEGIEGVADIAPSDIRVLFMGVAASFDAVLHSRLTLQRKIGDGAADHEQAAITATGADVMSPIFNFERFPALWGTVNKYLAGVRNDMLDDVAALFEAIREILGSLECPALFRLKPNSRAKRPSSPDYSSMRTSTIGHQHHPIRHPSPTVWGFRQGQASSGATAVLPGEVGGDWQWPPCSEEGRDIQRVAS